MSASLYKLAVPRIDGHVLRQRLLTQLQAAIAAGAITWLTGLPGAGKSSLAARWAGDARAAGSRVLWYRLDEEDGDVAGLFDALKCDLSGSASDLVLPDWSPEHQAGLRTFTRRFLSQLLTAGSLLLIFDDCHRLAHDSAFFEMLDAARELADGGLRILVISRKPPPPLLARGRVAGWLTVVDGFDLSPEETAAIVRQATGRAWSNDELAVLEPAKGWMAYVLALVRGDAARLLHANTSGEVGEYLSNELLQMLPGAARRNFRLLAELPELPRELVARGHIDRELAVFLDSLALNRYFVELTAADTWSMHDLLRDALRAQNTVSESEATLSAARRERARWVANLLPDAAMNLLVSVGDSTEILLMLQQHGSRWLDKGRHRQVLSWLSPTVAANEREELALLLWKAEAQLPLQPEDARTLFNRARSTAAVLGDADAAYRAWCGEVASYVVQWGAVVGLADLVDGLEQLERQFGPPAGEWRFRTTADALTALMYGRPEDPRIHRYAKDAAQGVAHAPGIDSRITAAAQLLIYRLWWIGDFPGARALYDAFDDEVERGEALAPLTRLIWWSNSAIVDWQCGDPARCCEKVDRGLRLAEASGVHVRDFFLLTQGIFCALSEEDWPRAKEHLRQLAHTELTHRRLDVMVHHFFRSLYCLSQGDVATALAHAEEAAPQAQALGSLFHQLIVLSALAPARLYAGDRVGAEAAYRAQIALAKGSRNHTFAYIAFCTGAEIALAKGDEPALLKQVERMLTVKQLGGFHSDCGWRTPIRARLLAFALERGILPEVARQWIREKRVPPPSGFGGDWPMPVRLYAFGGLRVEVDGKPDGEAGGKPSRRLRELLAVLVARRQRGVMQADAIDWIWSDSDGDKATSALKVAIHRLRGWLGHDAVLVQDGRVLLNSERVWCDLWRYEDHCGGAPHPEAGEVLAGSDAPPVLQLRKRLAIGE